MKVMLGACVHLERMGEQHVVTWLLQIKSLLSVRPLIAR